MQNPPTLYHYIYISIYTKVLSGFKSKYRKATLKKINQNALVTSEHRKICQIRHTKRKKKRGKEEMYKLGKSNIKHF